MIRRSASCKSLITWSSFSPLQRLIFTGPGAKLRPDQYQVFRTEALTGLARSYVKNPPPATFRMLVSPLVTWIWIGAIVVFGGGLIALWPQGRASTRLATAGYAARVARELGRA